MEYDRGDSFPLNFEPNGIRFGSKSKGKLSPRSHPIQCERKRRYSFLSARPKGSACGQPDRQNITSRLSETLISLGIMGTQLRTPETPRCESGVKRRLSLGQLCAGSCYFSHSGRVVAESEFFFFLQRGSHRSGPWGSNGGVGPP